MISALSIGWAGTTVAEESTLFRNVRIFDGADAEILIQATCESAEVIRLAGKQNRYDDFGEIKEGWLADVVLIDGDPFTDISILENPEENLPVILKEGELVKNSL